MKSGWEEPVYMDKAERLLVLDEGKLSELSRTVIGEDPDTGLACCPKESLKLNENRAICGGEPHGRYQSEMCSEVYSAVKNGESFLLNVNTSSIISTTGLNELIKLCESMGYRIAELDLRNPGISKNKVNIESEMLTAYAEGKEDEGAYLLAKLILRNAGEALYLEEESRLFAAALLYPAYHNEDEGGFRVGRAFDLIMSHIDDKPGMDRLMEELPDTHPGRKLYEELKITDGKKWGTLTRNIMISSFTLLMTMGSSLSKKDMDLSLPAKEKCAYFIYTEKSAREFPAAAIYTAALLQLRKYKKELAGAQLPVKVRFLLYDMSSIGEIPDIGRIVREAGEDVSFTISYRTIQELGDIFGDTTKAEEFLEAFDTSIYMGNEELDTTVQYYGKKAFRTGEILDMDLMGRLFGMERTDALVILKGQKPMKLRRYNLFRMENDIEKMKTNITNNNE